MNPALAASRPEASPLRPVGGAVPAYTQTLACVSASVAVARLSVRTTLECWGLSDLGDEAALVVSELVTNAVQHAVPAAASRAAARCRLTVERPKSGTVRIEVADPCTRAPVPRDSGALDENGRGLALVEHVCTAWGVVPGRDGKTVWAQLDAAPVSGTPAAPGS